jgi:DNA repair protein RadA/Sms
VAKERVLTTLLVGHVTKEGTLAGPRALEHVVDTVLSFDGERHHSLRLLHALKHRFGSTRELGLFEMTERGLIDVPDPSALFLADRRTGTPGSVVAPVLEGTRPLLVEVQALVHANEAPIPRRNAQGIDGRRLSILLAVLERRAGVPVARADVYASVAGGVRVSEAGADLALALAVASAARDVPVPADLVVVGEVGLGGEIRQVAQGVRRLAEAARLGFRQALVPGSTPDVPGLRLIRVGDVRSALEVALGLGDGSGRRRAVAA